MDPASIRSNNPGAQWFGPAAAAYGATGSIPLPGGNNAAQFPDPVSGAAAQFALLGKSYTNMPLSSAIAKWSGGNSSPAYAAFLAKQTGLSPDTVLTKELLSGPQGLALAKAQAHWEAGKPFPLSDEQWGQAQSRAFGGAENQDRSAPAPFQAIPPAAAPAGMPLFGPQTAGGAGAPSPSSSGAPSAPANPGAALGSYFAQLPASPPMADILPPDRSAMARSAILQSYLQSLRQS